MYTDLDRRSCQNKSVDRAKLLADQCDFRIRISNPMSFVQNNVVPFFIQYVVRILSQVLICRDENPPVYIYFTNR